MYRALVALDAWYVGQVVARRKHIYLVVVGDQRTSKSHTVAHAFADTFANEGSCLKSAGDQHGNTYVLLNLLRFVVVYPFDLIRHGAAPEKIEDGPQQPVTKQQK